MTYPDATADAHLARLRDRYLDVVRSAVQHTLYRPMDTVAPPDHVVAAFGEALQAAIAAGESIDLDPVKARTAGHDNDAVFAQTMTSTARLDNVRDLIEQVLADGVPGDLIEAGVWRGGIPIFMRAVLEAHGVTDRSVVLADSFAGLPPPNAAAYPADADFDLAETGRFAVDQETVRANFECYGLLDDQVEWVPGWFSESLPALADRRWAIARLDGDLYESTWDCLVNLCPQVSPGGFVIIDDWVLPPCRKAVLEYREHMGIEDEIIEIDWASVYWRMPFDDPS